MQAPPSGVEGWRAVWRENLRYRIERSGSAIRQLARAWLEPVVRGAGAADLERQRSFNLATLELIEELQTVVRAIEAEHASIRAAVRHAEELIPIAVDRGDALITALDQKIETFAARSRDLSNQLLTSGSLSPDTREDFLYRRLEDALRGSEAAVAESFRPYVEYAQREGPVIDVGCGRGEFLLLCREAAVRCTGFDTNERSVADLQARGFDAQLAGIPGCFTALADGSIGSILAAHVVEHLPVSVLIALFEQAARVLRRGGFLMIETPNAESITVSSASFWRDPTHLAPRHVAALTVLAREYEFEIEVMCTVHPFPDGTELRSDERNHALVAQLNALLFGNQDLRLVLRKS